MCLDSVPHDDASYPVITVGPNDLRCPQSILRVKSKPVSELNIDVQSLVNKMLKVLYAVPHGRGLSAIQIGVPARICVININRVKGEEIVLIDPELESMSGRLVKRSEGCMSLPDYKGDLKRRNNIKVRGRGLDGKELLLNTKGYEANVIMHELDHLDGILYWDRMPDGSSPVRIP